MEFSQHREQVKNHRERKDPEFNSSKSASKENKLNKTSVQILSGGLVVGFVLLGLGSVIRSLEKVELELKLNK